jgi:hypothetical protein
LWIDSLLLRFPVIGPLLTVGSMAQMTWALSTLLRSGVTVFDALKIVSNLINNRLYSNTLSAASTKILSGRDMASSIYHRRFPPLVLQMIAVGENTGSLDRVLQELGSYYEQLLENAIKRLSAMIEPAMILVIGSMVGFVYYAFFPSAIFFSRWLVLSARYILFLLSLTISVSHVSANEVLLQRNGYNLSVQPDTIRDPFTPSRLMYEVISTQSGVNSGAYGFIPSLQGGDVPKMKLRGYVSKDNESPVALLEIKGSGTFMVREGDEINIDPANPRQAIRISKITRLSVTVETGTLGSIRVLR